MRDLWTNVAKTDGCWEWIGTRNDAGYGIFWDGSRQVRAHRAIWQDTHGPIPSGLKVLHACDNPPCVRPEHLSLGTQAENMADMGAKERHFSPFRGQVQRGSANRNAKLSEEDIREIRALAGTMRHKDIARRYGVTRPSVSYILARKTWTHVE